MNYLKNIFKGFIALLKFVVVLVKIYKQITTTACFLQEIGAETRNPINHNAQEFAGHVFFPRKAQSH